MATRAARSCSTGRSTPASPTPPPRGRGSALDDVVVARRAPAALGGPAVGRTPAEDLEHLAVEAWAVALEPLGAWTLRSASGFTGRANSCLAVGDPASSGRRRRPRRSRRTRPSTASPRWRRSSPARRRTPRSGRSAGPRRTWPPTCWRPGWPTSWASSSADARVLVSRGAHRRAGARPSTPTARPTPTLRWSPRLLDGRRPRAFARVEVAGEVVAHRPRPPGAGLARGRRRLGRPRPPAAGPGHGRRARPRPLGRPPRAPAGATCRSRRRTGRAHAAYDALGFVLHHRYHYLAP